MTTIRIVSELRRADRVRNAIISKLAARVRRELVVPLCKRYLLSYRTTTLRFGDSDGFAFVTESGAVLESTSQARQHGIHLGNVLRVLARSTDEPGLFGGNVPLGLWVKEYTPPAWRSTSGFKNSSPPLHPAAFTGSTS